MTPPAGDRITVGLVRGVHGLRGAVRIEVLSDVPERFDAGSVLYVEDDEAPLTVAWAQPSKPGILVRFAELTTRESVEPLRGRYLEAIQEALPAGTWYWHQIEGLEVVTTVGERLGRIVDVFRAGDAEVYVVRGGPRGEVLVPGVRFVVDEVDLEAGRMTVDPAALALDPAPTDPAEDREGGSVVRADEAAEPRT